MDYSLGGSMQESDGVFGWVVKILFILLLENKLSHGEYENLVDNLGKNESL